jgi:hypothetical protein
VAARRTVGFFLVQLTLLVSAYGGLTQGPRDLWKAPGGAEWFLAACVTTYGVIAPISAIGLWRVKAWTVPLLVVWGLACATAAGFASGYYAEPGVRFSTVLWAAGATLLIAGLVVWYASRWLRRARSAQG